MTQTSRTLKKLVGLSLATLLSCLLGLLPGCGSAPGAGGQAAGFSQSQNDFLGSALAPSLPGSPGDPDPGFDPAGDDSGSFGFSIQVPELQCTNVKSIPQNAKFFEDLYVVLVGLAAMNPNVSALETYAIDWSRSRAFAYVEHTLGSQLPITSGNYTCSVGAVYTLGEPGVENSSPLQEYPQYSMYFCEEDPTCKN